jgi:hypothetical protein
MRQRRLPGLALFAITALTHAAPLPPTTRAEIDALLPRLQSSGCEFNRNGNWHAGAEAKAHLLKKLDYLERKDMVQTAEQFIERGASGNSMSGTPYLVRCADRVPVESALWLKAELQQLRAARAASGPR